MTLLHLPHFRSRPSKHADPAPTEAPWPDADLAAEGGSPVVEMVPTAPDTLESGRARKGHVDAHVPALQPSLEPAVTKGSRRDALRAYLFRAMDMVNHPEATPAEHVMARYETLRHWVPLFREWVGRPARAEAFFGETAWPPLSPAACGVLVGLTFQARNCAFVKTAKSQRGARKRDALCEAVHRGLSSVAALQPYGQMLGEAQKRESTPPLPKEPVNLRIRTWAGLTTGATALASPDASLMRRTVDEILVYPCSDAAFKKVRAVPEPVAEWDRKLPTTTQPHHTDLQNCVVSFVQYHNRTETGEDIVQLMRQLAVGAADKPELLSSLRFTSDALDLKSNFLRGALVGTLQLGMLHGLQDLQKTRPRSNAAQTLAQCKLTVKYVIEACANLQTSIDAFAWGQISYLLLEGIDAGANVKDLHTRISAYVGMQRDALKRAKNRPVAGIALEEQWRGVLWRMTENQVTVL